MWFEYHASNAHYRKEEYRMALKQISWIEKHFDNMMEDCLEFNNYSLRKGSVNHMMEVVGLLRGVYNSKYASKCLINTVKGVLKVQKYTEEQ